MNKDVFEGKWKEMRGQIKEWWGELTDDELEQAAGKEEQLVGLLQQKYGYTREHAEEEFERRLKGREGRGQGKLRPARAGRYPVVGCAEGQAKHMQHAAPSIMGRGGVGLLAVLNLFRRGRSRTSRRLA